MCLYAANPSQCVLIIRGRLPEWGGEKMFRHLTVVLCLLLQGMVVQAANADALLDRARENFKPIPDKPPALAGNPATPAKLSLGTKLYFEPICSPAIAMRGRPSATGDWTTI